MITPSHIQQANALDKAEWSLLFFLEMIRMITYTKPGTNNRLYFIPSQRCPFKKA